MLHDGYPLAYLCGGTHLVVVNPRRDPATVTDPHVRGADPLLTHGTEIVDGVLTVAGFGYGVFAVRG